uniref:Uncharacterized protein n=1 Tax=Arundo donax TaxID=35708 RepID=A0A0A8ZBE0_ARUDO
MMYDFINMEMQKTLQTLASILSSIFVRY